MKQSRGTITSLLLVGALVTACATTDESAPADTVPVTPVDSGSSIVVKDSGPSTAPTSTGPAKTCISQCKTDSECQTTCPAAPNGGLNCCDPTSGVCYASSGSSCGGVDGGTD